MDHMPLRPAKRWARSPRFTFKKCSTLLHREGDKAIFGAQLFLIGHPCHTKGIVKWALCFHIDPAGLVPAILDDDRLTQDAIGFDLNFARPFAEKFLARDIVFDFVEFNSHALAIFQALRLDVVRPHLLLELSIRRLFLKAVKARQSKLHPNPNLILGLLLENLWHHADLSTSDDVGPLDLRIPGHSGDKHDRFLRI